MNIHEYQAKELLRNIGVNVPKGFVVSTVDEAVYHAKNLKSNVIVIKAQIHAGGRGKAGGVKLTKNLEEVKEIAGQLLGKFLVTHQTGPNGKQINKILIEEGSNIDKEYYLSLVLDRSSNQVVLIGSPEGGTDIEEVANTAADKIYKEYIDPALGLMPFQAKRLLYNLGLPSKMINNAVKMILSLYQLFIEKDCSLIEINPLITTTEGLLVALDAKLNFDDNALFKHNDIVSLRDFNEEDPKEIEASRHDLNYISLDGNIGCMVNGAGLAMATMDIIKHYGGNPANFLDVGGSATSAKVAVAFDLILSDSNVKGIFINIFGGIMKCDTIAQGLLEAVKNLRLDIPLVVRLEGTNAHLGLDLLKNSKLPFHTSNTLKEGAQKVVELVNQ